MEQGKDNKTDSQKNKDFKKEGKEKRNKAGRPADAEQRRGRHKVIAMGASPGGPSCPPATPTGGGGAAGAPASAFLIQRGGNLSGRGEALPPPRCPGRPERHIPSLHHFCRSSGSIPWLSVFRTKPSHCWSEKGSRSTWSGRFTPYT